MPFGEPISYRRASIRRDGRVLAVGTDRGVALWDLARGTELPFLPIGQTWYASVRGIGRPAHAQHAAARRRSGGRFGSIPTAGNSASARRVSSRCRRVRDWPRTDRAGSWPRPHRDYALVPTPERTFRVGPLDDCRYVAVSPDGQWLATGSHVSNGAQVWRIRDGEHESPI